ncbi:hypothetical protein AMECASPLE_012106 [Ameca splendens]|uniref:Uncharacterized protein n=1 Tax=Ameca splendens TaxID=208324 RepID=A0ABV0XPW4_9TELE
MWVTDELVPISSSLRARGRVHPGQVANPSQGKTETYRTNNSFTPKTNLDRPINLTVMVLDCWRKPEYPERSHACTGRTCKLQAERPSARSRTQDLLAARSCERGSQPYKRHHD